MRKSKAAYMNYVCGICFHKLHECTCNFVPSELIMIDEGIQDCVRILNDKGYTTNGCCEGHYANRGSVTYISFIMRFEDLIEAGLPEGFKWEKRKNIIAHYYKNIESRREFMIEKRKALDSLLEWCARLPEMRYKAHRDGDARRNGGSHATENTDRPSRHTTRASECTTRVSETGRIK